MDDDALGYQLIEDCGDLFFRKMHDLVLWGVGIRGSFRDENGCDVLRAAARA